MCYSNSSLYASLRIDVHADFTALQAQADIAAQLRQGSCTPKVWEAFTKAYAQANAVLSDPCADEAKVESAALSLQQAIADVEHSSAYNDLSALCAQLESLKKVQYESESWDAMASLWEEAKTLLAQDDAQTDALITMKTDLQKAVDSLQAVQDSTSKDEGTDQEQTPPNGDETGGEVPKPPVQEGERLPQDTQQTQTPDVQTNPQETSADTAAIEMKDCWWVGALIGAGALSLLTLRRRTHR